MELCCAPIFEMRRVKLIVGRNGIETRTFSMYISVLILIWVL